MITILGATGFIGSRLVQHAERLGLAYHAPARDEELAGKHLGHIIYSIGLTADFRTRPLEAVEAHVCKVLQVIRTCSFQSFVYLSSTRLYKGLQHARAVEDDDLRANPSEPDDIYNLSKAMGESIVRLCGDKARIVRLSNVYGDDFSQQTFLSMIIQEALTSRTITLQTSLDSAKDYVSVNDVVTLLPRIAEGGLHRTYNLASGVNVTNRELVNEIARLTGYLVTQAPNAGTTRFPVIDISRIQSEFGFAPGHILHDLPQLIEAYQQHRSKHRDLD